jgi:hypothetical protein
MIGALTYPALALFAAARMDAESGPVVGPCQDPLPIDPAIVTREMKLSAFAGADQTGPVCYARWQGGSSPGLMIYGPTAMAGMGLSFSSAKQTADQYAGESPKGVEPLPGMKGGYMVFDPKIPSRRVFLSHKGKVYMIVSQDQVPLEVVAKAILGD